jgi:hypothetical protein
MGWPWIHNGESAILWAVGDGSNDWRWAMVRDYYYKALTSSADVDRQANDPSGRINPYGFDKLEILIALGYAHQAKRTEGRYWAPLGAFGYRRENFAHIRQDIDKSISRLEDQSPYVQSGIFGETAEDCTQALATFDDFMKEVARQWW